MYCAGAELTQTPSFKIAGIDVLATGEQPSPTRNEDEIRRLNEVASAITNLYVLYNVPMPAMPPGQYLPGPQTQRSFSDRDEAFETHEMLATGSPSAMGQDGNAKRARRYSQSSSTGVSAPYFRPALAYGDTASSESLGQGMHRMPAAIPSQVSEHADLRVPSKRPPHGVANPPKFMPIYTPNHLPHHPHHGYPYGAGQKVSFVSHEGPGMEGIKQERQHRVEDFMNEDENGVGRADHRQLSRLSIPSEAGDSPESANHTPKLTKTGRVSKALRGEPVHACNICDKVYTRAEHLRRHRSNHRVNLMRQPPER